MSTRPAVLVGYRTLHTAAAVDHNVTSEELSNRPHRHVNRHSGAGGGQY